MKMYLVVRDYTNDWNGGSETFKLFKNKKDAICYLNEQKEEIINNNYGYDFIEEEDNMYCESVEGEYNNFHDLVEIEELEVN